MATSSLIRLLTALLMLTGLALSSSLAWAHEVVADTSSPSPQTTENEQSDTNSKVAENESAAEDQSYSQFPPPEEDMPYTEYNQQRSGPSSTWIVTRDALIGGVFGAILGTAGYFISGRDWSPLVIVYSAAGGIVLGTTVGLVSVLTRDDRELSASLQYLKRDLPSKAHLNILKLHF